MAAKKTRKQSASHPTKASSPSKASASKVSAGKSSAGKSSAGNAKPGSQRAADQRAAGKKAVIKRAVQAGAGRDQATETDTRIAQIQRLIDVMVSAGAVEVELKEEGIRLRVRLKEDHAPQLVSYAAMQAPQPQGGYAPQPATTPQADPVPMGSGGRPAPADAPGRSVFTSPMVGTFYASSSPDSEPFVRIGDRVSPDSTLCILEAMKVMNEIKAEQSGSVVEVLVQNGQPVEYGQPLFVIQAD